MKIAVFCKSVPDTETKIRLKGDRLDTSGIKYILNPYDEFAVEEAVRMKEAKKADEVVAISMGPARAQEALRNALAIGADRAVLVSDDALDGSDTLATAKVLVKVIEKEGGDFDLLLFGQRAIDGDTWQVPSQVAALLDLPQATGTVGLEVEPGSKAVATRLVEGGEEVHELSLPAVISCSKGLNEPRYPSLPNIMKAKKKPLTTYSLGDLGIDPSEVGKGGSRTQVHSYELPPERGGGKKVEGEPEEGVAALVKFLKEEIKVI